MLKAKPRSKLAVFDNDDVLCDFLDPMLMAAGIEPERFLDYHTELNDGISAADVARLRAAFLNLALYDQIVYDPEIERLGELIELGGEIGIASNTARADIGEIRRRQILERVPMLRTEDICMNVITQEQNLQKTIPPNTFIFVDDSPYNIATSTAELNIMRTRRWNVTEKARRMVADKRVIWRPSLGAIIDTVRELLIVRIREDEQQSNSLEMPTRRPFLRG